MATRAPFITPIETVPNSGSQADTYNTILQSLPDTILDAMASMNTADFINRIQREYHLDDGQRERFAEFIRDILIGVPIGSDVSEALAERIDVDKSDALQILRVLERDILLLAGMSIKDIGRTSGGPEIREEAGRLLLRYRTLDDLLAAVENLSMDDRLRFLHDAKADNRIMVLRALSRLKLGVDAKGKPLSFRDMVIKEAPDFTGRDWADVLQEDASVLEESDVHKALVTHLSDIDRIAALFSDIAELGHAVAAHDALIEALARSKPAVAEYVKFSPYFAGLFDSKAGLAEELFARFIALAPATREQIISPKLSERIRKLLVDGVIPRNYGVAVAKITFFVAVGHLNPDTLPVLLGTKLGLGTERGKEIADRITSDLLGTISFLGSQVPGPEPVPERQEAAREEVQEVERSAKTAKNAKIANMKNVVDLRQLR